MDHAVDLGLAPDQRVELPLARALGEVGREGGERIGDLLLVVVHDGAAGAAPSRSAASAPERDSGSFEMPCEMYFSTSSRETPCVRSSATRLRVGLLEDRGDQIARVDLVALGVVGVRERLLDHAVERERLAGLDRLLARLARDLVVEEALQLGLEALQTFTPEWRSTSAPRSSWQSANSRCSTVR